MYMVEECKHEKTRNYGFRYTLKRGKLQQVQCLKCGKVFVQKEAK
jgi:uncharacterized OB-fold protein